MQRWLLLIVAVLAFAGCYAPTRGGGLTPYPPGPVDLLNIVLRNDYSRLCPERYEYCVAGKRSICCPTGACCDDGTGPYCCDSGRYADDDRRDEYTEDRDRAPSGYGPCGPRSTTCARGSITICCGESEGCCADDQGLYCCAASHRRY